MRNSTRIGLVLAATWAALFASAVAYLAKHSTGEAGTPSTAVLRDVAGGVVGLTFSLAPFGGACLILIALTHPDPRRRWWALPLIAVPVALWLIGPQRELDAARLRRAGIVGRNLKEALILFRRDAGRFPSTTEGLSALVRPPAGTTPILVLVPADPWGTPFAYEGPELSWDSGFLLRSAGPDQQFDTDDDLRFAPPSPDTCSCPSPPLTSIDAPAPPGEPAATLPVACR